MTRVRISFVNKLSFRDVHSTDINLKLNPILQVDALALLAHSLHNFEP